jgi:hypothetical protein
MIINQFFDRPEIEIVQIKIEPLKFFSATSYGHELSVQVYDFKMFFLINI